MNCVIPFMNVLLSSVPLSIWLNLCSHSEVSFADVSASGSTEMSVIPLSVGIRFRLFRSISPALPRILPSPFGSEDVSNLCRTLGGRKAQTPIKILKACYG